MVRGQFSGYRELEGVAKDSDTETFIALKVGIDNWRWAGVPIYLRTGKRMAEGMRIISIAFKEAPRSMFPSGSGVGSQGPDHLTFDLADNSKVSLSFYGKRPGPGMKLDKLSMQFSTQEIEAVSDVLEAYERLILDAMRGDHTLFTTAEGIESLWERSENLLADPPAAKLYPQGTWGPNAIHQLIAPNAWRLPFERAWRESQRTTATSTACAFAVRELVDAVEPPCRLARRRCWGCSNSGWRSRRPSRRASGSARSAHRQTKSGSAGPPAWPILSRGFCGGRRSRRR